MTIKWPALIAWLCLLAAIAVAVYGYASGRFDRTPAPAAPVATSLPPPPQVDDPTLAPAPVEPAPPVVHRRRPVKHRAVKHVTCSSVPAVAYTASRETIVAAMRTRGFTNTQIRDVLRCVHK